MPMLSDMVDVDKLMTQAHNTVISKALEDAVAFDDLPELEAAFQYGLGILECCDEVIPLAMLVGTLAIRLHRTNTTISTLEPGPSPE